MISNSFGDDTVQWVHEIAENLGIEFKIANLFIGGCVLETHLSNLQSNIPAYEYVVYDGSSKVWNRLPNTSIKSVLESEEYKNAAYRVIISHIPLNENSWHGGRHAWQHISQRFEDKGFDLMISGHLHKYRFYNEGVHHRTFPTLIIGADKFVDAKADKDNLVLEIKNLDGSVHKTFTYKSTDK